MRKDFKVAVDGLNNCTACQASCQTCSKNVQAFGRKKHLAGGALDSRNRQPIMDSSTCFAED